MKRSSYRDRDYAFGQAMLTLRTRIGLTQTRLAAYLNVSRRAVGEWEAGGSYPKVEHLKQLIALGIKQRVFPTGRELETIRELWQISRQKVLLDEHWLTGLLIEQPSATVENESTPLTTTAAETPAPTGEQNSFTREPLQSIPLHEALPDSERLSSDPTYGLLAPSSAPEAIVVSGSSVPTADGRTRKVDWGDSLSVPNFYGREWELGLLKEWVIDERCQVVSVLGMGGVGKSALTISFMHNVTDQFEIVIWRSLRDLPTCEVLLDDLLQVVAPRTFRETGASQELRMSVLLDHMRAARTLIVLDNLETVLEEGEGRGRMRPGYEGFATFLRLSAETKHQSCVVLTSREKPGVLIAPEGSRSTVRVLRLTQLDQEACEQLLTEKGVTGNTAQQRRLIEAYAGNPLALKIVAHTIIDLFDGDVALFLKQGEVIFGGVRDLLSEQFVRLSVLEQSIILWLAIMREPLTFDELARVLVTAIPRGRVLEAVEELRHRSLIERGADPGSFTLQSVVLEYITSFLVVEMGREIKEGRFSRLIEFGMKLAHSREYVRQTQERVLAAPILDDLRSSYPQKGAVEERLLMLLREFATWSEDAQGYGPANLVALLALQRSHLCGVDLSGLTLRNIYLQGVLMQDAALVGATIKDSIFTETFDALTAAAISTDGKYWAASSRGGEIRIWENGGEKVHRAWLAHSDMIWTLTFSPDGQLLASGSWDGAVKFWDVKNGHLLWSGRHISHTNRVVFSPNSTLVASCGNDATIRFWDSRDGTLLYVVEHPVPVPVIAWSPDGQLLASGDMAGSIRFWQIHETLPAVCIQTIAAHTTYIDGLDFSPDGNTLTSASWDGTIKLWDIPTFQQVQIISGHADRAFRVVWSPDGLTIASSTHDIWLWDVEQNNFRAVLRGHAARVNGLAFTPDSRKLISVSEDGTLRIWDVASAQCIHIIQGYTSSLYDIDWSPDGTQLVSGGTDYLVTLYPTIDETPPRIFQGHTGVVLGVGWSSEGQIASSEWDNMIRLWDPNSDKSLRVLKHPHDTGNYFYGVAWSPDGQRLASATSRRGVQVFELHSNRAEWMGSPFATWIRHVDWNPDGTQLVGGGDDGVVYIWDANDGTLIQQLKGHHRMITGVAWGPNGRFLASGSNGIDGGELFVWDVETGIRAHAFSGHTGIVYGVAWNTRETVLVSGGGDGKLRWWDVEAERCIYQIDSHQGIIHALKRSPDGNRLASCGSDGTIKLWDFETGEYIKTLRRDRPYERLKITGIKGLTDAQKLTLQALGAIE